MKKIILISLAFLLTACGASPIQQVQPTPIIVTVLVPVSAPTEAVVSTAVPPPTEVPTLLPTEVPPTLTPTNVPPTVVPPTAQVIVVTATTNAVIVSGATASGLTAGGAPIPIDDTLGKGVFVNMTMSSDLLSLRCDPKEITFNITANKTEIVDALLYYRIVDNPAGLYPSEWKNAGKMKGDGKGNFSIVFGGDDVNENLRLDSAWLELQFVGLNKGGFAVDRTEHIERLITYRIDCQ